MNYADMNDRELKMHFFAVFQEQHGKDGLLGWLKATYLAPMDAASERQIIINSLNNMKEFANAELV